MIASTVTVVIDRPLGSSHTDYSDMIYPLNYGYVPGVIGGDGEELDAYVLGVDLPVKSYTGRVIAIIHRLNDVEDKLVVAPTGMRYTKEQIIELTSFQERYFKISVEML